MKCYKVMRREGNRLYSFGAYGRAKVEYIRGQWARPPEFLLRAGYGLLAFRELQPALRLCTTVGNAVVYAGEGEGIISPMPNPLALVELADGKFAPTGTWWEQGTVMVSQFLPEELVGMNAICYVPLTQTHPGEYTTPEGGTVSGRWGYGLRVCLGPERAEVPDGFSLYLCDCGGISLTDLTAEVVRVLKKVF